MNLMAMADSCYRFISVDIGQLGCEADGGVWEWSNFNRRMQSGRVQLRYKKFLAHNRLHFESHPFFGLIRKCKSLHFMMSTLSPISQRLRPNINIHTFNNQTWVHPQLYTYKARQRLQLHI